MQDSNAHLHSESALNDAIRNFGIEVMSNLPYDPNPDQMSLIAQFGQFCLASPSALLLSEAPSGYASAP